MRITQATLSDTVWVAERLRDSDRQEVETASGQSAVEALAHGFHYPSALTYVSKDSNDVPFMVFGITPSEPTGACIWMVGTDDLPKHARWTIREARLWIREWHRQHGTLFNTVDARNTLHIKWLRLLKFNVDETLPITLNNHPFYPITYQGETDV